MPKLEVEAKSFKLREAFTISRGSRTEATVVEVRLIEGDHVGRGECVPYARYNETVESVTAQIEGYRGRVESGTLDRQGLQGVMKAGAARNALDLAFWDLEAKRAGCRVWELKDYLVLGGKAPGPVVSCYTLSIDTPEAMKRAAAANAARPILKVKLGAGEDDMQRVAAVREGAPDARIVIDANEGWQIFEYGERVLTLKEMGVEMIEQPVPQRFEDPFGAITRPVPICADESCHTRATLNRLVGRYDMVNIKLDKTGGLTEALQLRTEAERQGMGVMVGCMMSSSLAVAPAVLLSTGVQLADLDPPMLLAEDRDPALAVEGSTVQPPMPELWG
ncbi:MAG: N-acetyl-D-Glu racemase DgcA [Pseudomonadota bacterium]